jgi:hypothetical protein
VKVVDKYNITLSFGVCPKVETRINFLTWSKDFIRHDEIDKKEHAIGAADTAIGAVAIGAADAAIGAADDAEVADQQEPVEGMPSEQPIQQPSQILAQDAQETQETQDDDIYEPTESTDAAETTE